MKQDPLKAHLFSVEVISYDYIFTWVCLEPMLGKNVPKIFDKKGSKDIRPQMLVKHGNGNVRLPTKQKSNFTPELYFTQDIMHRTHFQPQKELPFLCQHYVSYVG